MRQLDLGGGSVAVAPPARRKRERKTMQELHGFAVGKKCKDCDYVYVLFAGGMHRHKCALWRESHGPESDVIANGTACGWFEPKKEAV